MAVTLAKSPKIKQECSNENNMQPMASLRV